MRATIKIPELSVEEADKLIAFLEGLVNANVRVPLLEGPRSGSVSLDEGTAPIIVSEEGLLSNSKPGDRIPAELQADERPVLLGRNDAGCTNEGVHEGQPEEASPVDLYDHLIKVCNLRIGILDLLDENTKLGGKIVKLIMEQEIADGI